MPNFNSSAVKRGEYDPKSERLTLWFSPYQTYTYCQVPHSVWEGLLNATSKGKYFNAFIDGKYHC